MEKCEDIRHTIGMKEVYAQGKETVERLFGTAKENHGFRYTQMIGKARMEMKSRAYVCLHESEKTGKDDSQEGKRGTQKCLLLIKYTLFEPKNKKNASGVLTKSVLSIVCGKYKYFPRIRAIYYLSKITDDGSNTAGTNGSTTTLLG